MVLDKTLERLTVQNLVNAYCYETSRGEVVSPEAQSAEQKMLSVDRSLLVLQLAPMDVTMAVPVDVVSRLGQHRIADAPSILRANQWVKLSAVSAATLLLDDIAHRHEGEPKLDTKGVLKRWIESYEGLSTILAERMDEIDDLIQVKQDFIETEQNLIYGHAMHPTPKGREGFYAKEWHQYAPETASKTQLNYWLVHPDFIVEEFVDGDSIAAELKSKLLGDMSEFQAKLVAQYPEHKLLPLHPWQAKFLHSEAWYQRLREKEQLIDLGKLGWELSPTTSVRTLAAYDAPWMFKVSISVAITNSVRINLPKECKRGLHACRIWRSEYGTHLSEEFETIGVLNDPAWIALKVDGKIINESICILRDNDFTKEMNVTNLASLTQDHPTRLTNRFDKLFNSIHKRTNESLGQIALQWFDTYLRVAFIPLIHMYYRHGVAFEVHQQNSLIELQDGYPAKFWARDNQGFGYIAEYASPLIDSYPELISESECVVPEDFADERVAYYLVGNTIFGLITAIARTQHVSEDTLLSNFREALVSLEREYPHRSLFEVLLRRPTLPFKGNLMTRMHALDELTAPVESQSVYVDITNPLRA